MNAWNHQKNTDHLRHRAETYIAEGRARNEPSAASMGHRLHTTKTCSQEPRKKPYKALHLSDMSRAVADKK